MDCVGIVFLCIYIYIYILCIVRITERIVVLCDIVTSRSSVESKNVKKN